ncbi:MAG: hypothetical protein KKB50_20935 [Planctomycetes bacterium]|nr:hypothetical protein [Planctomycetota bacterium]
MYDEDDTVASARYEPNDLNHPLVVDRGAAGESARAAQRCEYDGDGNPTETSIAGDMNCDGVVNGFDTRPFIGLLGTGNAGVVRQRYEWDAENRLLTVEPASTPEDDNKQAACT